MPLVRDDAQLGEDIRNWQAFVRCALSHPVIPRGAHTKRTDIETSVANPELRRFYANLYQLYSTVDASAPFREPVNALESGALTYYDVIRNPMSLRDILDNVVANRYGSVADALRDLELVWKNCEIFNGAQSSLYAQARTCAEWLRSTMQEAQESEIAPLSLLEPLMTRIEQAQSDELLQKVHALVLEHDPSLIIDGDIVFDGMRMGLFRLIDALVESHMRPRSVRSGRATPLK